MKEAAARDRVTLRKCLRNRGLWKSEGEDLKETEGGWIQQSGFVGKRLSSPISSSFFLFSLLLGMDFQYQLQNTVSNILFKLCLTVKITDFEDVTPYIFV